MLINIEKNEFNCRQKINQQFPKHMPLHFLFAHRSFQIYLYNENP